MQFLLTLFRTFRAYIIAGILAAFSILLITTGDTPSVQVLRSAAVSFLGTIQNLTGWLATGFSSNEENEALRDVNMTLMEEVMQLRRLRWENQELRSMLAFRNHSLLPLIPAEIIGKNFSLGQTTVTLNVGERDSVLLMMPVITERGLVGKIVAVSHNYSIVQLAMNREFRITAKVNRSHVDGIIAWKQGDNLLLQNVWKTADVLVGDTIITSEYSNTFPPDIPIGIIQSIGHGDGGLFSKIEVRPHVQFKTLERVFVIRYTGSHERDTIESGFQRAEK